jgi:formylglycine-generating enzyme required for sulfatase activity
MKNIQPMNTAAATNTNHLMLSKNALYTFLALLMFCALWSSTAAVAATQTEPAPNDVEDMDINWQKETGGKRGLAPFVKTLLKRYGVPDEYLDSGEPRCSSCHTSEMRPAIDYTTDAECLQCHSADYGERFLDIDERYKVPLDEATESYRQHIRDDIAQLDRSTPPPAPSSTKKTSTAPPGMVLITAGEFIMGTNDWWPKSGPEHKRTLPDFFIDTYEVTNRDYMEFVVAKGHGMPDHWRANKGMIPAKKYDHPVTYVNWFDSDAYCKWRGKRLPTEAEWEKAARGTDGRVFPWGNEFGKSKANTPQYGKEDTMRVGSFEEGKSPYGAYDLAGNVFEWTADWYMAYPGNKHPDPNEGERYRVVRGGSWYDCTYYKCGISAPTYNRIFFNPYTRSNNFGMRCVQDAK